jgi:sigma-B regulation protein RsbU (phosphoserine phosphatase)
VHDIPGLEFAANAVPSRTIDGDFYNLYYLKPDSVDLLVGDVMGKGIPAALVGAATRAKFAQATLELFQRHPRQEPEPREIVAAAHDHMVDELIQLETFATLHYVRCDVAEGRLDYVDCGNTPLLHYRRRSGATWVLKGRNVPLGFSKDEQYEQFTVPVHEGDILLSFSDGITEATNDAGEAFGEKRLIGLIDANPGLTSGQLVDTISRELETFTGGKRFKDDVTLVALRIGEKAERCRTSSEQHRFEPRLEQSRTVRETVLDFLSKLPQALSERDTQAIALATNEAFTNICRHSQTVDRAPVELELTSMRSWLSIRFEYTDDNFRWTSIPDPDFASLDEGGYGVYLMREVADSVTYSESSDGRMSVCLSKKLS